MKLQTPVKSPRSILEPYRVPVYLLLLAAALVPMLQIFVPVDQFIHRGDDAFYYFEVALNYAELGFWTFDGINPTNGVQPLWAIVLSGFAVLLDFAGIEDKQLAARVFVGLCVSANILAAILLFEVLRRTVSIGTGLAAACAFLLPLGIVWQRSWGMESSLYALMLTGTVAWYHFRFLPAPSVMCAVVLGLLLGLLALSRLNAGLFVPILLAHYLFATRERSPVPRFFLTVVVGLAASAIILPYLAHNWQSTGHLMPISGAAKIVYGEQLASAHGDAPPLSLEFWRDDGWRNLRHLTWFASSRIGDGLWMLGSRFFYDFQSEIPEKTVLLAVAFLILLPVTSRQTPGEWRAFVSARFKALSTFWYVLAFGLLDAALTLILYSRQLGYAVTRWWWVENEIILVCLAATLGASVLSFLGRNVLSQVPYPKAVIFVPLALLAGHQAKNQIQHYWSDERRIYDWNLSGNEAWLDAARWLNDNVDEDRIVGGWNAGVLGYYSDQPVINLDGLINNFEYLDYLREGRIEDYIDAKEISYLADMDSMFEIYGVPDRLQLEPVYEKWSDFYRRNFVIYEVLR